ncbi:restriction endonuclease subunit S, partial [Glaesserella parasuis]|nr:restriction endonuclease subunit S [Glaesserella parasuis]
MNKVKLGDCIELIIDNRGKTPPLAETGYELIETVSINGSNKYPDYSKITKFVSEETYNTWFRKGHPTSGDILISTVGMNIGDVVIMKSNRGSIAQNLIALRTNNKLNSDYLYYILTSKNIREKIRSLNIGSAQPSLKVPHLLNIEFYLPNIEKQSEISKILNELDEKIEINTQINQTLEQIAQTIFKSWFIDFDPVHAKANALASGQTLEQATQAAMAVISGKNTQELHRLQTANPEQYQQLWEIAEAFPSGFSGYKNLGEIPIGWNVLTFKDFISESKEKIGSLEDVPEYSVGNEGIYPRSEKYNKSLSKTPEKNKVVRIGDLVFGMGSKTLNWGIMNDEIGSVSPAYFVYRIFTNINYIYLNKYIKAKEYDFQNLIKPTSRQGQSVDKEMF